MDTNAFGKLVRASREQHGWKQDDLAERWGFTREYVSQVERGKRKLDKLEQVIRLADILGISEEQLAHVGKERLAKRYSGGQHVVKHDDRLLEALLEPAAGTVKLYWLLWQENDVATDIRNELQILEKKLNDALGIYSGQFYQPALRILASVHELLGRQAVERTATQEAITHFQGMYDIAEELGDSDLLTLAMIHLAAMLRRKGRFEASFRRLGAAERSARGVSCWLQGLLAKTYARNFYVYGDEQGFLRAIDQAANIAEETEVTLDTTINGFDKTGVLEERAQGYTLFGKPEKALAIYQETDKMRPFRPLRAQSAHHIAKAQAYCYRGDLRAGIEHALTGLHMAEELQSIRYVVRLQQMCDRLKITPIGKERVMLDLRTEILRAWDRLS